MSPYECLDKIDKIIPGSIALGTGCISALVSRCSKVVESVTVVISSSIYLIEADSLLGELEYEPSTSDL